MKNRNWKMGFRDWELPNWKVKNTSYTIVETSKIKIKSEKWKPSFFFPKFPFFPSVAACHPSLLLQLPASPPPTTVPSSSSRSPAAPAGVGWSLDRRTPWPTRVPTTEVPTAESQLARLPTLSTLHLVSLPLSLSRSLQRSPLSS
jgi:hypothetical protein